MAIVREDVKIIAPSTAKAPATAVMMNVCGAALLTITKVMSFDLKQNKKYLPYINFLLKNIYDNSYCSSGCLNKKDIIKLFSYCLDKCFSTLESSSCDIKSIVNYSLTFFKYLNADNLFQLSDEDMTNILYLLFKIKYLSIHDSKKNIVDYCKSIFIDENNYIIANIILASLIQFDCVLIDVEFSDSVVTYLNSIELDTTMEITLALFHL